MSVTGKMGPEAAGGGAVRLVAHGIVQGVGFRYFVERTALSLGLAGYVRNLPSGAVEIRAVGDRRTLEELVEKVREGPRAGRVEEVEVSWDEAREEFHGFHVRF